MRGLERAICLQWGSFRIFCNDLQLWDSPPHVTCFLLLRSAFFYAGCTPIFLGDKSRVTVFHSLATWAATLLSSKADPACALFRCVQQRHGCQCLGFLNICKHVSTCDCTLGLFEHPKTSHSKRLHWKMVLGKTISSCRGESNLCQHAEPDCRLGNVLFQHCQLAVLKWYENVCVSVDGMNFKYALRWHIRISVHSMLC